MTTTVIYAVVLHSEVRPYVGEYRPFGTVFTRSGVDLKEEIDRINALAAEGLTRSTGPTGELREDPWGPLRTAGYTYVTHVSEVPTVARINLSVFPEYTGGKWEHVREVYATTHTTLMVSEDFTETPPECLRDEPASRPYAQHAARIRMLGVYLKAARGWMRKHPWRIRNLTTGFWDLRDDPEVRLDDAIKLLGDYYASQGRKDMRHPERLEHELIVAFDCQKPIEFTLPAGHIRLTPPPRPGFAGELVNEGILHATDVPWYSQAIFLENLHAELKVFDEKTAVRDVLAETAAQPEPDAVVSTFDEYPDTQKFLCQFCGKEYLYGEAKKDFAKYTLSGPTDPLCFCTDAHKESYRIKYGRYPAVAAEILLGPPERCNLVGSSPVKHTEGELIGIDAVAQSFGLEPARKLEPRPTLNEQRFLKLILQRLALVGDSRLPQAVAYLVPNDEYAKLQTASDALPSGYAIIPTSVLRYLTAST